MLHVLADKREAGILDYQSDKNEFIFNYTQNNPISLTMPYTTKSYLSTYIIDFSLTKNLDYEYKDISNGIL